jgi:hypothetical protein
MANDNIFASGWQKSFIAIILKVKTKSRQCLQVILVLILNEALKMKIVKQKVRCCIAGQVRSGHYHSVEGLQGQAGQEE